MKDTTTVLHVTTVHPPYNPRIYHKEVKALASAGWHVLLATTTSRSSEADGVRLLPLGAPGRSRLGRIPRNLRALKFMLGRNDIIHIHDPELLVTAAIARLFGRHIVYDVHEFYHSRFEQDTWMPRFLRPAVGSLYALTERLVLPRLSGIVVVSEAMIPYYSAFLGEDRIATIRNLPTITAEDVARHRRAPRPLAEPYILHVGEASTNRMFHITVRAAELLREMGNVTPIVNVGGIDLSGYLPNERAELLQRAKDADVRLIRKVPYEEAMPWIAHAHVGYMPLAKHPRNINALPVKLFEYFAFGLPVVAPAFGAIEKNIDERSAGLLVPYDDPVALAKAFHDVTTDAALHQRLSAASQAAGAEFAFEKELPKLEALYRHILSGTRGGNGRRGGATTN